MELPAWERDYYVVTYTTNPPLTGTVQASFDGGTTWIDGEPTTVEVDGEDVDAWSWLVAGPAYDAAAVGENPADTKATISKSMEPRLRLTDSPVTDGKKGPRIDVLLAG